MGRRLKELTQNNTKCMVKVNGVTLIERLLSQLEKYELSRIVIVVGYEGQKLIARVPARFAKKAEENIQLAADLEKVHIFDKETELAL